MIEERLATLILEALRSAAPELGVEDVSGEIELTRPPRKELGDFSTNVAFRVASLAPGRKPRDVAELIVKHLPEADFVSSAEVAGAGFVNLRVKHDWLYEVLRLVAAQGDAYG